MRYLITPILLFTFCLTFGQINVDIRTLGAVGDSATLNTIFIQQAIDSVSNHGGGTVLIDNGIYSSSTIILKSNVTLRITPGTKLKAPANDAAYPFIPYNTRSWSDTYTQQSLIFAEDASNIRITGGGIIDGNGFQLAYLSITKNLRPFGLRLHHINGLIIDSINLQQAPQWMGHIMNCNNVHINAVTVYNQCLGSNDGFDIDGCRTVLVENCNFDTNDDCVPIKTHSDSTCRDVIVRNCTMATYERPVKVGNESLGPIINVTFQNITVNHSSFTLAQVPLNAIYVAIADGGSADSIFIDNIQVNTPYTTPIFVRLCQRNNRYDTVGPPPPVQYVRNVFISNVTCTGSIIPSSVSGLPGYDVENVQMRNINLTVPGGAPAVTGSLPELPTTRPECNIWGDSLPAYGLFVWHQNGLFLDSFCVTTVSPDVRPEYYFIDTLNIPDFQVTNGCSKNFNSIADLEKDNIRIYPNPANDRVTVDNLPAQVEALVIYTLTGERVSITPTLQRNRASIPVSNMQTGVYILNAVGNNYSANTKLVVVR